MPVEVQTSGNPDIDGILWGYKWTSPHLTYSFPSSTSGWPYGVGIGGFKAFTSTQIAAATRALDNADAVCGLTLTLALKAGAGDLRWGMASRINYLDALGSHAPGFSNVSAEGVPPDPAFKSYSQGHMWFNKIYYNSPDAGSYAYASGLLHELGHALGLKHGQDPQDAHGITFPKLPWDHDSQEYSVMTYNNYPGGMAQRMEAPLDFPTTYMQDDIAALQYLYGADYAFRAGNTSYRWDPASGQMFVDGHGQGAPLRNKIFLTVWDGGGSDTFDFSNYRSGVVVNLSPGAWSTPSAAQKAYLGDHHFARGCIATALLYDGNARALIENVRGGLGDDRISGNIANNILRGLGGNDVLYGGDGRDTIFGGAGQDRLCGGKGADTLIGGDGRDWFIFSSPLGGAGQVDRIQGYEPGIDLICLDHRLFSVAGVAGHDLSAGQFVVGRMARDANDRIIYDPESGLLSYDSNGVAVGGSVTFAVLDKHLMLKAGDFHVI